MRRDRRPHALKSTEHDVAITLLILRALLFALRSRAQYWKYLSRARIGSDHLVPRLHPFSWGQS